MKTSPLKVGAIVSLAFVGMIDTLYLSLSRRSGPIPCHITSGCEDVVTSVYSPVAGIPLAWFGLAFYLTVFGAAVFEGSGNSGSVRLLVWPATFALIASIALTGIQAFVLEAYCEYCLGSAALSTGIFFLVMSSRGDSEGEE